MKTLFPLVRSLSVVALCLLPAAPVVAQPAGIAGDLLKDISGVEEKVMALAKALPDSAMAWRPGPGVRSTAEVFQHIAADNYFMPTLAGATTPKEIGITKDFKTAAEWEKKPRDKAAVLAELTKSFAFLKSSLTSTPAAQLDAPLDMFGQKSTTRGLWLGTATHLHEHLGQLIAYARTNKVTPPWSK